MWVCHLAGVEENVEDGSESTNDEHEQDADLAKTKSRGAPDWTRWNEVKKWKEFESKIQKRRSITIDPRHNDDKSRPRRGDDNNGWQFHWRRGLVGCLQDWAEGRRYRIVFMLSRMATHFSVQQEVQNCVDTSLNHVHLHT